MSKQATNPRRDRGMTTAEYAVGTVGVLAAFAICIPILPIPIHDGWLKILLAIIEWLLKLLPMLRL